jgi:SAM-dependent methyltransferase
VNQMGTATMQAELWGARARDWAEVQEGVVVPLYEAVLHKTAVGFAAALLDVGCGAGMFCELAAKRGAQVTGIDATAALIAIARERVPQGDFRVGEMEELPYTDNAFDLVIGFNSFQFAASPVNALREAGRVARKGASIVIAVWGKPEDTEAAAYLAALGSLLPPPPPSAPGPFALSQDGALEALVTQAGLSLTERADVDCLFAYRDEATALRGLLSAGPAIRAIQTSGEERVRDAVAKAIAPFRTASGSYVLKNKFRYLIATA